MIDVGIKGLGAYAPERRLTNADLEKMVETNDEWITTRTGIAERRLAGGEITTSGMAVRAARAAMLDAGLEGKEPGFVIASTATAELTCPTVAARVGQALALKGSFCFDLNAACSGFIYALAMGASHLRANGGGHGLVVAGEQISGLTDYHDRASCILFGDGAGAAVLSTEPPFHKILHTELGADPSKADLVLMGGQECYGTGDRHFFWQDGRGVFRFAVEILRTLIPRCLEISGAAPDGRFHIIPHQANLRMMEHVAKELDIPMDRFVMNIQRYGNTSSASIGLAMTEAAAAGRFRPGDKLLMIGFGGGLTWGAMVLEW